MFRNLTESGKSPASIKQKISEMVTQATVFYNKKIVNIHFTSDVEFYY